MFHLYHHNGRSEKAENPTLKKLLDLSDPFIISTPVIRGNFGRDNIVYSDWGQSPEPLLRGILVIDYSKELKYFVRREQLSFKSDKGTAGPWHSDKFRVYANIYEYGGAFQDLLNQFRELGFSFPE